MVGLKLSQKLNAFVKNYVLDDLCIHVTLKADKNTERIG